MIGRKAWLVMEGQKGLVEQELVGGLLDGGWRVRASMVLKDKNIRSKLFGAHLLDRREIYDTSSKGYWVNLLPSLVLGYCRTFGCRGTSLPGP